MKDYIIKKPRSMIGYPIHRAVAALAQGGPHLWRDNGETVTIRCGTAISADGASLPDLVEGELRLFHLRACVGSKIRGRHIYAPQGDFKTRYAWLDRQAMRHGFQIVSIHCTSQLMRIANQSGKDFLLDSTDFTGVLKVIDCPAMGNALRTGIGSKGKAFGFSLLSI